MDPTAKPRGGSSASEAGTLKLPFDELVSGFERLIQAIAGAEGAFQKLVSLADGIPGTADGARSLRQGGIVATKPADTLEQSVRLEQERLNLIEQSVDDYQDQGDWISSFADHHADAAGQADEIWGDFGNNMVRKFSSLFDQIVSDGELSFKDIWSTFGSDLLGFFKGQVGNAGGPVAGSVINLLGNVFDGISSGGGGFDLSGIASSVGNIFSGMSGGSAGASGGIGFGEILNAGTSLISNLSGGGLAGMIESFAMSGVGSALGLSTTASAAGAAGAAGLAGGAGAAASASALTSMGAGLVAAAPYLAIAAVAIPLIMSAFEDKQYPFAKNDISVSNGKVKVSDKVELDDGDIDTVNKLGEQVTDVLQGFFDQAGGALGSIDNLTSIGFASGRKSILPEGWFAGGMGNFATGADFVGLESAEEAVVRAIQSGIAKAMEEDEGVTGLSSSARKTISIGIASLMENEFEDLETSLGDIEFLGGFNRKLHLAGVSIDEVADEVTGAITEFVDISEDYNFALRKQQAELKETAKAFAQEGVDAIREFVDRSKDMFGSLKDLADEPTEPEKNGSDTGSDSSLDDYVRGGLGNSDYIDIRQGEEIINQRYSGIDGFQLGDLTLTRYNDGMPGFSFIDEVTGTILNAIMGLDEEIFILAEDIDPLSKPENETEKVDTTDQELRIAAATAAAQNMVNDFLAEAGGYADDNSMSGYQSKLFTYTEQIKATEGPLNELNESLEALGGTTIDVAAKIADATEEMKQNLLSDFGQDLDDIIDPAGAKLRAVDEQKAEWGAFLTDAGVADNDPIWTKVNAAYETLLEGIGFSLDEAGNAVRSFSAELALAVGSLDEQISEQEAAAKSAEQLAKSLQDTRDGFALDANLSVYSPLEKLNKAKANFDDLTGRARDGDQDAREELAGAGRTYLELARDYHASSSDYADIFNEVDEVLSGVQATAEGELSVAQDQLEELRNIRSALAKSAGLADDDRNFGVNQSLNRALAAAIPKFTQDFGGGNFSSFLANNPEYSDVASRIISDFQFADGGVMTAFGALPLARYASGGVATTPQVAIFGEGRLPEAYVPLPDGRSIPVTVTSAANDDFADNGLIGLEQVRASKEIVSEIKRMRSDLSGVRNDNAELNRRLDRAISAGASMGRSA